jgi:multicomponent Na+:H+ antiporter subunit F
MTAAVILVATVCASCALAAAVALTVWSLVRGPATVDRAIALDMLGLLLAAIAAVIAFATGEPAFVDIALGIALVGFLAAVAMARLVENNADSEAKDG